MTETKTVERDMSVFAKQTMKNSFVKDKLGRPKVFAQYSETATATDDELCGQHPKPRLPRARAGTSTAKSTRNKKWHDPSKVTCRIREG
jgi:hypothetical protein